MAVPAEPLSTSILAIMYLGDVVFSVSGALTAARYRVDIPGFVLIGTITGIGGGTTRDLLLGRTVWWTHDPTELILCVVASLITFFFIRNDVSNRRGIVWLDALGLSAFSVAGCHVALESGSSFPIGVIMGMVTATGSGVIRDVLTKTRPLILCGQPYATAAILGSLSYATLRVLAVPEIPAEVISCLAAFSLRACAIIFDIRIKPLGQFIRLGSQSTRKENSMDQQLEILSTGKLLHVKVTGKLTKEVYEQFAPLVDQLIQEHVKLRILFEMHDFHGWTAGALWEDLKFDFKHWKDIERLAIVGESKWEKGMTVFCGPFTTANIRYYDHLNLAEAKAWLSE